MVLMCTVWEKKQHRQIVSDIVNRSPVNFFFLKRFKRQKNLSQKQTNICSSKTLPTETETKRMIKKTPDLLQTTMLGNCYNEELNISWLHVILESDILLSFIKKKKIIKKNPARYKLCCI